eukprot:7662628-Prorocentrum_lima.AAC.1
MAILRKALLRFAFTSWLTTCTTTNEAHAKYVLGVATVQRTQETRKAKHQYRLALAAGIIRAHQEGQTRVQWKLENQLASFGARKTMRKHGL